MLPSPSPCGRPLRQLAAALGLSLTALVSLPAQAQTETAAQPQSQPQTETTAQTQAQPRAVSPTAAPGQTDRAPASAAIDARGRWLTESGNLEIEIAPCEGGVLCGRVVKVLANRSMRGPGETLQAADPRPVMGMEILSGLIAADDGILEGRIYNRENGRHYSVRLSLDGPSQLLVRPYVALPVFGKTQLWQRVAAAAEGRP